MRSDREEMPEGFTKEEADRTEIQEANDAKRRSTQRGVNALAAPTDCRRYWPVEHLQVCGEIRVKYDSLGGSTSFLGPPSANDVANPDNYGRRQTFWNGPIYWSPATGAHPVVNSFLNRWGVHQYEAGRLKYPTTDEIVLPDGGRRQEFQQGAIYVALQNAIGSAIFNGPLRDKYNSVGGLTPGSSFLGYPTEDQRGLPDGQGQMDRFQNGVIYWHPTHGAHPVAALVLSEWAETGYESGSYGYPVSDQYGITGGVAQDFQGGKINVGLPLTNAQRDLFDCQLNVSWPAVTPSTNYVHSDVTAQCSDPKQKIEVEIRSFWTRANSSSEVRKGAADTTAVTEPSGEVRSFDKNYYSACFNGSYRYAAEFRITNADGGVMKQRHTTEKTPVSNCQTQDNACPGISTQDCNAAFSTMLYAYWFNGAARPNYSGNKPFQNNLGHLPPPSGQYVEYDAYPAGPNGRLPERVVLDSAKSAAQPFWFSKDHFTTQDGYTLIQPQP